MTGISDFSLSSQRALTNRAMIPGEPRVPIVTEILAMSSAVVLFVDAKLVAISNKKTVALHAGGSTGKKKDLHPVLFVHIEAKEGTLNVSRNYKFEVSHDNKYLIPSLTAGVIYQFRCRFENDIGYGVHSNWSPESRMPAK